MPTGVCKKWVNDRGFGFITPEDGGQDVFVHMKALQNDHDYLTVGEKVEYEVQFNSQDNKLEATACTGGFYGGQWVGNGGSKTGGYGKANQALMNLVNRFAPYAAAGIGGGSGAGGGIEVCRDFAASGNCKYGAACKFVHGAASAALISGGSASGGAEECKNFKNWGDCKFGDACKFVHVAGGGPVERGSGPDSVVVCKNFQQWGECKFGASCKFAH